MVSKLRSADPVRHQRLEKVRGLYQIPVGDEVQAEWEARRQHVNSLSSLSLFRQDEGSDKVVTENTEDFERPITPIPDSVKFAPKTYSALSKLIHRRINPRDDWDHISKEDQSSLGGVIMGEVNAIWPELRRQVSDPFLTYQQNKELQRRITIHCVTVCEQLFLHYSHKIEALNRRGVFSNPANMSRIRAQLALDAGKYLDVLSVRRHIINDLKKPSTKEVLTFDREEVAVSPTSPAPSQGPKHLSFKQLVKSSRPKLKLKYHFNLNAELQSLQSQLPTINVSKVHYLLPTERSYVLPEEEQREGSDVEELSEAESQEGSVYFPTGQRPMHRRHSEPILEHELIIDELKHRIEEDAESVSRTPLQLHTNRLQSQSAMHLMGPDSPKKPSTSLGLEAGQNWDHGDIDSKDPKQDLKILFTKQMRQMQKEKDEQGCIEDPNSYIPTLIRAITRRAEQNEKVRQLKIRAHELDEKRKQAEEELKKPLPEPQYPQPAIVETKLPGITNPVNRTPITIRVSDIKISDRVDLSNITLDCYNPIYNDLSGEISQAIVKELDANLFQGGELREVYTEIMKTVPNVHQQYDNDAVIVTPGSNVDLSKILASSTLVRPRSQQVINPNLRRDEQDVPWEGQQMPLGRMTRGHQQFAYPGSEVSSQVQVDTTTAFHQFSPSQLNHSGVDKGSRAYASWLQWWKNTINTDDYFKYLSTQDTDFLSVLFHFYDSDAAESETDSMRTAKLEAQRERDRKLNELKKEKEEFMPGWWNVKAVVLGGLGKDPELEDEGFSSGFDTPQLTDRSQSSSHNTSRSQEGTRSSRSPRSSNFKKLQKASVKIRALKNLTKTHRRKLSARSLVKRNVSRVTIALKEPTFSAKLPFFSTGSNLSIGANSNTTTSTDSSYHCTSSDWSSVTSSDQSNDSLTITDLISDSSSFESDSGSSPVPRAGAKSKLQQPRKERNKCTKHKRVNSNLKIQAVKLHNELSQIIEREKSEFRGSRQCDESESAAESHQQSSRYAKGRGRIFHEFFGKYELTSTEQLSISEGRLSDKLSLDGFAHGHASSSLATKESSGYCSGQVNQTVKDLKDRKTKEIATILVDNDRSEECGGLDDCLTPSTGWATDSQGEMPKGILRSEKHCATEGENQSVKFAPLGNKEAKGKKKLRELFTLEQPVTTAEFLKNPNPCSQMIKYAKRRSASSRRSAVSSKATTSMKSGSKHGADANGVPQLTLQERLEIIWRRLKMPDSQKLDCALKYSTDNYIRSLPDIVSSWERVTDLITRREEYMRQLEIFEKDASDPNRFFARGHKGSSAVRLNEAKTRAKLYKKLEAVEAMIKASLLSIQTRFSDTVTYSGRAYMEKMGWDKVEMLYWLQQERRCTMLRDNGNPQQLDMFLHHGGTLGSTSDTKRHTNLPLSAINIVPE